MKQTSGNTRLPMRVRCALPALPCCCFFTLQKLDTRHHVAMVKVKNIFCPSNLLKIVIIVSCSSPFFFARSFYLFFPFSLTRPIIMIFFALVAEFHEKEENKRSVPVAIN